MDRVNGAGTIDIGAGRRGFSDEDLAVGQEGTEVTAHWLNMTQEEIIKVIEVAGLALDPGDWTQLWQALQILGLSSGARSRRWTSVISMTTSSAPGAPVAGDTYLVPAGATGIWATHVGKVAEWSGTSWFYFTPVDGHGVSLPDGRVFERVGGSYVEKLALDVQSGKWNYAVAGGTANALTATLFPTPASLTVGMELAVKVTATNTAAATLNVNGTGALPITTPSGVAVSAGDLKNGSFIGLIYTGTSWMLQGGAPAAESVRSVSSVYFAASQGALTQSIPGSNVQTIITALAAETQFLQDSTFSAGTFTVGPKDAGTWLLQFSGGVSIVGSVTQQLNLTKNGNIITTGGFFNGPSNSVGTNFSGCVAFVSLAAGDVVRGRMANGSGSAAPMNFGAMGGVRLGA